MYKILRHFFIFIFFVSCNNKETPPNIIFIMSDDHAFQAVSAYGHNLNNTPNIDRIAKEGAIFNKGFVTNSICAPSRAVMLTGKHSFVNGKVDNVQPFNWDQPNFAKDLQKVKYLYQKYHDQMVMYIFDSNLYNNHLEIQNYILVS